MFVISWQTMIKKASLGVAVRSTAFSPDGGLVAAGLQNGAFMVLKTADLKVVAQKRDRHQAIQDIRYGASRDITRNLNTNTRNPGTG